MIKRSLLVILILTMVLITMLVCSCSKTGTSMSASTEGFVTSGTVNTKPNTVTGTATDSASTVTGEFGTVITQAPVTSEDLPEPAIGTSIIVTFKSSDKTKGFVTSRSGILTQTIEYGKTWTSSVSANAKLGYKFVEWSDGVKEATRSNETFRKDCEIEALFDYDTLEMPILSIDVEGGSRIYSKTEYLNASLSILNTDKEYTFEEAPIEIRGRGNYSWSSTEKKSYRIKLAEKKNLLGQGNGPARSWTLLAVHCDQSLLRTATAFKLSSELSGIDYTSSLSFVELYLNGEYMGVFNLCEQMQIQQYRVNITEEGETTDIGYLLELNKNPEENIINVNRGGSFEVKNNNIKSEQLSYIEKYMNDCFTAVRGGKRTEIEKMIDLDSVIDTYIVEEYMKNLDVGWGSFYMYKPTGDKLYFGPVWDFDLSAGNAEPDDYNPAVKSPKYLYAGNKDYGYRQQNEWFLKLCEYEWFKEAVAERWEQISGIINALPKYASDTAKKYENSFERNFERWPIFGQKINREPFEVLMLLSYDKQVKYLTDWLTERAQWMTKYYKGEVGDWSEDGIIEPEYEYIGSGGEGTGKDPYIVSNSDDFEEFTKLMQLGIDFEDKYFAQTADIDLSDSKTYNGVGGDCNFSGHYDGRGHSITVYIKGEDESVFPYLYGSVVNLMTHGRIENTRQAAGICRSVRVGGAIINCGSDAEVISKEQYAAGIATSTQSGGVEYIMGCFFVGSVSGASRGSGIVASLSGDKTGIKGNYYINTCNDGYSGNTAVSEDYIRTTLADTLNENLQNYYSYAPSQLMTFTKGKSCPVFKQ